MRALKRIESAMRKMEQSKRRAEDAYASHRAAQLTAIAEVLGSNSVAVKNHLNLNIRVTGWSVQIRETRGDFELSAQRDGLNLGTVVHGYNDPLLKQFKEMVNGKK